MRANDSKEIPMRAVPMFVSSRIDRLNKGRAVRCNQNTPDQELCQLNLHYLLTESERHQHLKHK